MHEACIEACTTAASLFGPLGELAIVLVAGALVVWSRWQLRRSRGETTLAKTEVKALRTAIVSLRPDAAPTVEQALRAPALPQIVPPEVSRETSKAAEEEEH